MAAGVLSSVLQWTWDIIEGWGAAQLPGLPESWKTHYPLLYSFSAYTTQGGFVMLATGNPSASNEMWGAEASSTAQEALSKSFHAFLRISGGQS